MSYEDYFYLNRTVCDVLEEMRKSVETMNMSYLPGLIEETQSMVNKMEAAIGDIKDFKKMKKNIKTLEEEVKELRKEKNKLEKKD